MEGDGTDLTLEKATLSEKARLVSTPHSLSMDMKPSKIDECDNTQANQQDTLSPITVTKSFAQESHTSSDIKVSLENESVWSRFHSLGTEMILTKQGRRMFPCCRFKLNGLDPQRKYFLVMDFLPLDDFTHKWNGKTWEPVTMDVPHVPCLPGQICVHPESPALGQQWMDNPVSFYKVKLTSDAINQEGCVLLRPMNRYQPRLHIAPVDPDLERTIVLNSPNVKIFSFPQTEFYAVTSYQNPQITRLKIDCNPFAMAFREDSQSINLVQNKLRLCSSVGTHFQSPLLRFTQNLSGKWKEGTVKSSASTSVQDNRVKGFYPRTASHKEGEGIFAKMRNNIFSCTNNMDLCRENTDYSESDRGHKSVVNEGPAEPVLDEHVAPLNFDPSVTVSLDKHLAITDETVPLISSTENPKSTESSEKDVSSPISCTNNGSCTDSPMAAQTPQTRGEIKSAAVSLCSPPFLNGSQSHERNRGRVLRNQSLENKKIRKSRSKWWTHVKRANSCSVVVPPKVPSQPDLEDVEGMLFVSFVAKEALNARAESIKESETSPHLPSSTHDQSDNPEPEDVSLSVEERIARLEKILLLHLKQLKHRQVIHPCLQDVGMKLSLLDPKVPIDLQYLGVHLPPASPVPLSPDKMTSMSLSPSPDAGEFFVSRTGKTNDPTKIKGWREKFKASTVQSAPEGLKNSSAFCSEMLDAYLENEAQQISDRAAVFSKCSTSPVSYQLPSKSSSYVVTLDSLLQTRSSSSNKVHSKPTDNVLPKSPRSASTAVSLSSAGIQRTFQGNRKKGSKFARSFQARNHVDSTVQASRSMSFSSRPGMNIQPGKFQPGCDNNAGTTRGSRVYRHIIPVKEKKQMMLKDMEEEAIFNGKIRTHITTNRAQFALNSLINFKKRSKRPRFHMHDRNEDACPEYFCRLGCICDSLARENRGPTHCRRVECMFDCSCFKHKVILRHPPNVTNAQRGRKRSVLAFSIADPVSEPRPPPARSITTLRNTTAEHDTDTEPLFTPISSNFTCQVREEDKDPVYLYFERMMTCARVREYNSNPPPQIHMFPARKGMREQEELSEIAEAAELPSSQNRPETNLTEKQMKPGEPKPPKLLEILSECNWEPHRSLLLSAIFQRMKSNLMSEPFCFKMYKIQPLSTTTKEVNRSSTITYKVCISRADEEEMTDDLPPPVKKAMRNQSLKGFESKCFLKMNGTQAQHAETATDLEQMSCNLVEQQQNNPLYMRPLWDLPFIHDTYGYLKADKKKPGNPRKGLIKVNGKPYSQAKVLLGRLGALHPVNRIAAFVTGRLKPVLRDQHKIESDATKYCPNVPLKQSSVFKVANALNQSPSKRPVLSKIPLLPNVPEPNNASENKSSNTSSLNAPSNLEGPPSGKPISIPDGSRFVLLSLTPLNSAAAPLPETVTSSGLPPGQQVVLHPAPGMPGSNFLCQYNGQIIQLKPITPQPLSELQPRSVNEDNTSQVMQTAYTTSLPKDTGFLQSPLNSTPHTEMLPNTCPIISPKSLSLSAKSGMNIANGMPAFNLQSRFPGKAGTFTFRICPPTDDRKPVGSEPSSKTPEPSGDSSSSLILPGGFTLIKLFHSVVPTVPTNVIVSHPAEIPQNGEGMKQSSLQSCSSSLEQNCQVSERITQPPQPETSNCISAQPSTASSGQSSSDFPSDDVTMDAPVIDSSESVNTVTPDKHDRVPDGAVMVHTSVNEVESQDMDDWPPNGVERILWTESADEEENENLKIEPSKNLDVVAESPAAQEASESKTTPTGTVKAESSSSDCYLQADSLNLNARELDARNASSNSPNITEKVIIQEKCHTVLIKNESYDRLTDTDMTGNEPYTKNQGLPETSTLPISKIQTCTSATVESIPPDHFHFGIAKTDSVSIKIESCSDVPFIHSDVLKHHTGSENILPLTKKEESSMTQIVTTFSNDLSFGSEGSSQIFNHNEFHHKSIEPTSTPLHSEYSRENIGIAGNAPCSLLDGQTSVMDTLTTEYVLNTACLKTVSPFPRGMNKSPPVFSKINKQDLTEGKDGAENRIKPLMCKAAVGEACDVEEITVDVMELSESEDGLPSDRFDREEDSSSDDGQGDSYSDEDESSDDSSSDSEQMTTNDAGDISNDDDVDIESVERILNSIKKEIRYKKNPKRSAKLRKKIKHLSSIISAARYLPKQEIQKRQNHTKKERVRRNEMRQAFTALQEALNIEEGVKMCRHDILNQARIMIWALEDRSRCLEEKKKALFQKQIAYLNKIVELSEYTKAREKATFTEKSKHQKRFGSQKTLKTSVLGPPVNPQRLDSDGNRLPPRFGSWKAPNYVRKRSKKVLQPSVTTTVAADEGLDSHLTPVTKGNHTVSAPLPSVNTEDLVRTLITQNPICLPPVCKSPQQKSLLTEPKHTEKLLLPKIVLPSLGKTEAEKLTHDIETSLPSSTELLKNDCLDLQAQSKGMEKCSATRVSNEIKKTHVSEQPTQSSAVTEGDVQKKSFSKSEKDKPASAAVSKLKKKRGRSDVAIQLALSNPDIFGPRQLRQRSPAVNVGATIAHSANKRRRIH